MIYVNMYTDGSAKGNPDGPGGYGVILKFYNAEDRKNVMRVKELTKGFQTTTNNRMEMMAFIAGLEDLTEPCDIILTSDSQYLINSMTKGWIENWVKNNWVNSSKQPVKNRDLWERILYLIKPHHIQYVWVRGHHGHPENERCDYLATSSADGKIFTQNLDGTLSMSDEKS